MGLLHKPLETVASLEKALRVSYYEPTQGMDGNNADSDHRTRPYAQRHF